MEARPRIGDLGGELIVFFQAPGPVVEKWFAGADLPADLRVAADEEGGMYEALGTERPSWFGLMKGGIGPMVRAWKAGYKPKASNSDMRRQGADVVVGDDGEVAFLHRAADADDRIEPERLIAELEGIAGR